MTEFKIKIFNLDLSSTVILNTCICPIENSKIKYDENPNGYDFLYDYSLVNLRQIYARNRLYR